MKPPTAAQKRCLLQAVSVAQAGLGQQTAVVDQALVVLRTVSAAAPGSASRAPRGSSAGHAGATPAASAWAALLVDLVRRGKDRLDAALAAASAADSDALHDILQLSWALLDALASMRCGWKGDSFLAVRPAWSPEHHEACLVPFPVSSCDQHWVPHHHDWVPQPFPCSLGSAPIDMTSVARSFTQLASSCCRQVEKERYIIVQRLTKAGLHAEALHHARLLCADVCAASCQAQARAVPPLSLRRA